MRPASLILTALVLALVVGLGGYLGGRLFFAPPVVVEAGSPWVETQWPFLRDGWPKGRAFRCGAADCGEEILFFARVKLGLCDCTAGIADDEDLERVSDVSLIAPKVEPDAPGQGKVFAGMQGWTRSFHAPNGAPVVLVGGGRNCNAFVGMASARSTLSPAALSALDSLLNGPQMSRWILSAQGLPKAVPAASH
jgi:hypothetical protein